jgi:hypothetical protein
MFNLYYHAYTIGRELKLSVNLLEMSRWNLGRYRVMPVLQWDRSITYPVSQLLASISTNVHKMRAGNPHSYINSK